MRGISNTGLLFSVLLLFGLISGCATPLDVTTGIIHFSNSEKPWDKIPAVTLSAPEKDPRIRLSLEAVDFWNRQLSEIGTPFRLGPVNHTTDTVPDYLTRLSEAVLNREPLPDFPEKVKKWSGDVVIAMSDEEIISFSTRFLPGGKVVVGIRDYQFYPLTLPNVARNVIAHELGHAIGLGHNNDPTKLMCGRPAPCRPDSFQSDVERFFPLSEENKAFLLKLYPSTWKPGPTAAITGEIYSHSGKGYRVVVPSPKDWEERATRIYDVRFRNRGGGGSIYVGAFLSSVSFADVSRWWVKDMSRKLDWTEVKILEERELTLAGHSAKVVTLEYTNRRGKRRKTRTYHILKPGGRYVLYRLRMISAKRKYKEFLPTFEKLVKSFSFL